MLADTLAAYLDGFGDIAAVAQRLHVHPNTVRYRVRRIEKLLSTSLDDPDDRLVLALGLRGDRAALERQGPCHQLVETFDRLVAVGVQPAQRAAVGQIPLRVEGRHENPGPFGWPAPTPPARSTEHRRRRLP